MHHGMLPGPVNESTCRQVVLPLPWFKGGINVLPPKEGKCLRWRVSGGNWHTILLFLQILAQETFPPRTILDQHILFTEGLTLPSAPLNSLLCSSAHSSSALSQNASSLCPSATHSHPYSGYTLSLFYPLGQHLHLQLDTLTILSFILFKCQVQQNYYINRSWNSFI